MRVCVLACVRMRAHLPPKITPIKPRVSKVSLYKCVFIYLSSFRKLGNWKPRGVYNQISTNIQAAHIQLLTRPEPTYTLRSSLAKHHVEHRRATKIMPQSDPGTSLLSRRCPATDMFILGHRGSAAGVVPLSLSPKCCTGLSLLCELWRLVAFARAAVVGQSRLR